MSKYFGALWPNGIQQGRNQKAKRNKLNISKPKRSRVQLINHPVETQKSLPKTRTWNHVHHSRGPKNRGREDKHTYFQAGAKIRDHLLCLCGCSEAWVRARVFRILVSTRQTIRLDIVYRERIEDRIPALSPHSIYIWPGLITWRMEGKSHN